LLAAAFIKDILIGANTSEIYTPYAGAAGMFLHIDGKFTIGKLKSSL
jgi:hypothetical protein